jgi:hypothetical protein
LELEVTNDSYGGYKFDLGIESEIFTVSEVMIHDNSHGIPVGTFVEKSFSNKI